MIKHLLFSKRAEDMEHKDYNLIYSFASFIRKEYGEYLDKFGTRRYNINRANGLVTLDCYLTEAEYSALLLDFYKIKDISGADFDFFG